MADVSRLNLIELAPALRMPVFFFLGRKDHFVPPETSAAYFDALTAPSKKLVWYEHSGHEMFVDEPDKFNAVMTESVRPTLPSDPQRTRPHGRSRSVPRARNILQEGTYDLLIRQHIRGFSKGHRQRRR